MCERTGAWTVAVRYIASFKQAPCCSGDKCSPAERNGGGGITPTADNQHANQIQTVKSQHPSCEYVLCTQNVNAVYCTEDAVTYE